MDFEIMRMIGDASLAQCQTCISEKTPLFPYVGKIKLATPTPDGKGVLFTIRCEFPDLLDDTHTQNDLKELLSDIIERDSMHMIVMQR